MYKGSIKLQYVYTEESLSVVHSFCRTVIRMVDSRTNLSQH